MIYRSVGQCHFQRRRAHTCAVIESLVMSFRVCQSVFCPDFFVEKLSYEVKRYRNDSCQKKESQSMVKVEN